MPFDSPTITALSAAGLVIVDFITITGKNGAGDPVEFDYWTGPDNVTTNVVSAVDGTTDSRNYIGGGVLGNVPAVVDGIGLEARQHTFGLSALHASVLDMVNANNIRTARVELQRGYRNPDTWALVSTPFPAFLGRVDGLSVDTGASGEDGQAVDTTLSLMAVTDAIDLTRMNPALKSDEQQRIRSGDRIRRYADAAGQYDVWWGQARGAS